MSNTLIFDIGKTNKKWFLFDPAYRVLSSSQISIEEISDEDGYPCDDLAAIVRWVKKSLHNELKVRGAEIGSVNFSTYGATLVHLDNDGNPLTPLYNYLKPYPEYFLNKFYKTYGESEIVARMTASPQLGMLNSGMQLYWLKHAKPEIFERIKWTLHFPQYLSYLFTANPVSEYTSIGCHTGLWDFEKMDYHDWVYQEEIDRILPPIVGTNTIKETNYADHLLKLGVGIHDSSAALIPYLMGDSDSFILLSTGTWSIALNPFSKDKITDEDLAHDCLNFLRFDGRPVRVARLFLGNEYALQEIKLKYHFASALDDFGEIILNEVYYNKISSIENRVFRFESLNPAKDQPLRSKLESFKTYEEAMHQLMYELVELQAEALDRVTGKTPIEKIYVDGGFAKNSLFISMLSRRYPELKLCTISYPQGSALGTAMILSMEHIGTYRLQNYFKMKTWLDGRMIPHNTIRT